MAFSLPAFDFHCKQRRLRWRTLRRSTSNSKSNSTTEAVLARGDRDARTETAEGTKDGRHTEKAVKQRQGVTDSSH